MRADASTIGIMPSVNDDMTVTEAAAVAKRLFGEAFNLFRDDASGVWYAGRFLDGGRVRSGERQGKEVLPWHRKQEIFGAGRTMREALRFATGRYRVYSIPGMRPGLNEGQGYTPHFDRFGRIVGWTGPGGVFSKAFPSSRILTA